MLTYFAVAILFCIAIVAITIFLKFVSHIAIEIYFWITLLIEDIIMKRIVK